MAITTNIFGNRYWSDSTFPDEAYVRNLAMQRQTEEYALYQPERQGMMNAYPDGLLGDSMTQSAQQKPKPAKRSDRPTDDEVLLLCR